jgi:hypothetical protein
MKADPVDVMIVIEKRTPTRPYRLPANKISLQCLGNRMISLPAKEVVRVVWTELATSGQLPISLNPTIGTTEFRKYRVNSSSVHLLVSLPIWLPLSPFYNVASKVGIAVLQSRLVCPCATPSSGEIGGINFCIIKSTAVLAVSSRILPDGLGRSISKKTLIYRALRTFWDVVG